MKVESTNLKVILGGLYLIVLFAAIYFLFSNFDLKDLTSYDFIKENRETILKYKDNNIFFLSIIFFIITIFLNLLLTPMILPTLIIGFIFSASTIWNTNLMFLQSYAWLIGAFVSSIIYYSLSTK